MELPSVCSAFSDPDLDTRLKSLEELTAIAIPEHYLQAEIVPRLMNYLDDCEEVLILVITQIEKLSQTVQLETTVVSLLKPLINLANIIEESVRIYSVQTIIKILKYFSIVQRYCYNIFKQLVGLSGPGIISALELVSSLFSEVLESHKVKVLNRIFQVFTQHRFDLKVKVAEVVSKMQFGCELREIFEIFLKAFLNDPEDLIRISGISLSIQMKFNIFSNGFNPQDISWRVRYYLGQHLSFLIDFIDPSQVCSIVKEYLLDEEPEVINITYSNLSVLFRHSSDQIFINEILSHIQKMSQNLELKSLPVISSVLELCPVVGHKNTELYLRASLQNLLNSSNANIEILLMEKIDVIFPVLTQDFIISHTFPVFTKLLEHKQWKIKAKALEYLSKLARNIDQELFDCHFIRILLTSLNDLVHAVRLQAILTASDVCRTYGNLWLLRNLKKDIEDKCNSECFVYRITAANLLHRIVDFLDFEVFGEFFVRVFKKLAADRVVNVRIFAARLAFKVKVSRVLEQDREEFLAVVERLANDADLDVRKEIL